MPLLPSSLRRMTVAAVLLSLCVVCASLVTAVSEADFSVAEQTNTRAFLLSFVASNSFLANVWSGTDFCTWQYVNCDAGNYSPQVVVEVAQASDAVAITVALPDLPNDVDGSSVIFKGIAAEARTGLVSVHGSLPASWGRLTRLAAVDCRNCGLTGTLSAEWQGLTSLKLLGLQNNGFTGSIPAEWGTGMTSMAMITAQGNSLCGCIPAAWVDSWNVSITVDASVSASDCATANACPTTAPTPTTSATLTCGVNHCAACASESSTVCATCSTGYSMGAQNTTCTNGSAAWPSMTLLMAVVLAVSGMAILM